MDVSITFLSLSSDFDFFTDENAAAAGEAGGIETVVKAMNTHINNPDMCENGCGALNNMTANNGKRTLTSLVQ